MDELQPPTPLPGAAEVTGYPLWVERFVLPFVRDSSLLPILIAIIGHFSIALAPLLLWVFRAHNPVGAAALLGFLVLSVEVVSLDLKAARRPAGLSAVLFSTWALAGLFAWIGNRYGLL